MARPEAGNDALCLMRLLLGLNHGLGLDSGSALDAFNLEEVLDIIRLLGLGLFFLARRVITRRVGAVGIMNVMLVVVSERTREIGLRKALGAPSRAVCVELLSESLVVTVLAGRVGMNGGADVSRRDRARRPDPPRTRGGLAARPRMDRPSSSRLRTDRRSAAPAPCAASPAGCARPTDR